MTESTTRCGFVALAGRPNVGKSTLLNALIGSKISIVTPKPQTTRHRIVGVRNEGQDQILFVDTPGMRAGRHNLMGQTMNRNAELSIADADLVIFVCDTSGIVAADRHVLDRIRRHERPVIAVLNKIDRSRDKTTLLPILGQLGELYDFELVLPMSAKTGDNIPLLLDQIRGRLPASPWLYPADQVSDRDDSFRAAETVREKLMLALADEVPYGLSVEIEKFAVEESGLAIDATIWVARNSQKPIVIGKQGERLKKVGRAARLELKARHDQPVHLNLWVKVKKNWADSERSLLALGYEVPR